MHLRELDSRYHSQSSIIVPVGTFEALVFTSQHPKALAMDKAGNWC